MSTLSFLQEWINMLEKELAVIFPKNEGPADKMYQMMQYHLGWRREDLKPLSPFLGGKYLRPILCLLSYYVVSNHTRPDQQPSATTPGTRPFAFGERRPSVVGRLPVPGSNVKQAMPLAASIELEHNATLILDDVEDGDQLRRSRPTVWKLWGIPQGVNTGDAMTDLARQSIWKLLDYGVSKEIFLTLLKESIKTSLEIREGQYLDISFENKLDVTTDEYLCMIGKKTAALIEFSAFSGAYLAAQDTAVTGAFRAFGNKLGIAMQIRDDLVGIWGEGKESGKFEAADLKKKKKTLPVIYAMEQTKGKAKEKLHGIYAKSGPMNEAEIIWSIKLLNEIGAYDFCYKITKEYEALFLPILESTNMPQEKLQTLLDFARLSCDSIGKLRNHMEKCISD